MSESMFTGQNHKAEIMPAFHEADADIAANRVKRFGSASAMIDELNGITPEPQVGEWWWVKVDKFAIRGKVAGVRERKYKDSEFILCCDDSDPHLVEKRDFLCPAEPDAVVVPAIETGFSYEQMAILCVLSFILGFMVCKVFGS